ncbi:phage tail tape-measure protein, partial [Salmonella enterica]|nr:phage tail tape-measure protein [Salmonella enterica]
SDLSSDAYDFEQTQEQINEQFDNMIDNLKIMAEHQHKSISSPEFVKQIADINKMRGDALEDNLKGYNNYEDNLHSVLAGAKKGMKSYQETSDKVALQVAQVWDKSLDYMTDSLADFFTTGETGWKNYLKDILTMIEKVMVRDVIVTPFSNWMGGLLGVGSSSGVSATESSMDYNSLPVPSVPNLSATKTSGVGSSSVSGIQVYVYNQGGNTNGNVQSSTKQGQDLGKALQRAAQNWIKQQNVQSNRQGGTNKAMNSWSVK